MKQEKMIMKSIRPRTPLAWSTAIEKSLTDSYNLPALPFYMLWRLRIILVTCFVSLEDCNENILWSHFTKGFGSRRFFCGTSGAQFTRLRDFAYGSAIASVSWTSLWYCWEYPCFLSWTGYYGHRKENFWGCWQTGLKGMF